MILHLLVCIAYCAAALASRINFYQIHPKNKSDGLYLAHISFTTFRSKPGGFRLGDLSLDINHSYRKYGEYFLCGTSKRSAFEDGGISQLMMMMDRKEGILQLSTNTHLIHTLFHIRNGVIINDLSPQLYPQHPWYKMNVERNTIINIQFGDRLLFVSNRQDISEDSYQWDMANVKEMLTGLRPEARGNEEDVAALLVEFDTSVTESQTIDQGSIFKVKNTKAMSAHLLEQKWLRQPHGNNHFYKKFFSPLFSPSFSIKIVLRGVIYPQGKSNYKSVGASFGMTATANQIVISDKNYVNNSGKVVSVGIFQTLNQLSITLQDGNHMDIVYEGHVPLIVQINNESFPETIELEGIKSGDVISIVPRREPYGGIPQIDYDTVSFEEILHGHGLMMAQVVDTRACPNEVSWN